MEPKMTNQDINERIAKLCGWIPTTDGGICWDSNGNAIVTYPNYAGSLDICRDFIGKIHGGERNNFVKIAVVLERVDPLWDFEFQWALITLTPRELCEVYLKLKGQWDEN